MPSNTTERYLREKKRFIIELMTGVSLERWEQTSEQLKAGANQAKTPAHTGTGVLD